MSELIGTDGYPELETDDHYGRRAWQLDEYSSASWLIEGHDRRAWAAASAIHWGYYGQPLKAANVEVKTVKFIEDWDEEHLSRAWTAPDDPDGVPVLEF